MSQFLACTDGATITIHSNGTLRCANGSGSTDWEVLSQVEMNNIILSQVDTTALTSALYTIDLDVVGAIFGGSLTLLVTGIGFGWLLSVIRLMK